jgi:phosphoglycolate phosphatase-like HAD superfamily hydrolase
MDALNDLGLLPFFDPSRIITHNDVADAQRILGTSGKSCQLGKPHPFILLRAIYPDLALPTLLGQSIALENHAWVAFVGDTLSDVLAAKAARAWSLCVVGAVANPVARQERKEQLLASGCDLVLDSIADLPPVMLSNHQRTGWNEKHS